MCSSPGHRSGFTESVRVFAGRELIRKMDEKGAEAQCGEGGRREGLSESTQRLGGPQREHGRG